MAVTGALEGFISVPVIVLTAITCDNPPLKPVPVGAVHVYKVPAGTIPLVRLLGLKVNATPLQLLVLIEVMAATGLMVTVTVNTAPVQLPDNGVTIYVAVWAVFSGLLRLPLISTWPVALAPPVSPPVTDGIDQLYKVPDGTIPFVELTGVTSKATPLQLTVLIAVITAVGLIVMVTVNTAPVQLPDNGVMI